MMPRLSGIAGGFALAIITVGLFYAPLFFGSP